MRTPRWLVSLLLTASTLLTVTALAACNTPAASGGSPSTAPTTTPPTGPTLAITRSGGFAGVNQKIEFSADGSWVYTDARKNTSERGTLTEAQRVQLITLMSSPDVATEMAQPGTPCPDAFSYTVEISGQAVGLPFSDCRRTDAKAIEALLAFVAQATPF